MTRVRNGISRNMMRLPNFVFLEGKQAIGE